MGIADRGYYGDDRRGGLGRPGGMSFNTMLIIANIAIFVLDAFLPPRRGEPMLRSFGHFSTAELIGGLEFWRVITFQFLHADVLHVALNMFGLWVFGKMVEEYLGFKRYAAFYLVCGVSGAVMYMLLNLGGVLAVSAGYPNIPVLIPNSIRAPLIGASAGVFGVIMAAAYVAPRAQMQLLFPPVTLPLRTIAYAYVGIAFFNLLIGSSNAGGEAAHIGGAIAGYFFVRNSHLLRDFFDVLGDSRKNPGSRPSGADRRQKEIDRILAKVSTKGLQSLTAREKRTLADATQRQQKAG
jgi:membrane associated rhomboid family serine protease